MDFITESVSIWLCGWFSLGLVEVALRFTIGIPPLPAMSFFTLLVYLLVGTILGAFFGVITLVVQRSLRIQQRNSNITHFSMAFCIFLIILLYVLLYFLKVTFPNHSLLAIFKSGLLFAGSITLFFLLYCFFWWMERKGRRFILYISILPSLWIVTSLTLNMNKKILPPVLQVTTFSRAILLILGSVLCFFFFYLVLSLGRRFINRWGNPPFLKLGLLILPFIFLSMLLFLFLKEGDKKSSRNEIKNAPTGKPNIILITLDTVRADHLSCYGYKRLTTPNLDRLSREAVLYKNAYAPAPWTLASHASMFTGKYPTKHGANFNPDSAHVVKYLESQKGRQQFDIMRDLTTLSILKLSEENITLAEILSERGYRTAGIIGGPLTASIFGLAQGFDYYNENFSDVEKDIRVSLIYQVVDLFFSLKDFITQYGYSATKRLASHLNKVTFRWLENNHGQPFFLFINYFDAHNPYIPPPPYDRYLGKGEKDIIMNYNFKKDASYVMAEAGLILSVISGNHQLSPEEKELLISRYDGEIRYLDHCLGHLFEKLKVLNIYDNTLIIITSDHGEAFGEHGLVTHLRTLYEELLRVPLIIKYPSSYPRRGVVEKRVSLVDLFPTILSFLGYPVPSGVDGEMLVEAEHPIIAEWYYQWWDPEKYRHNLRAVYQGKEKYIWASSSLHEFYDLEKDPGEEENLIAKFPQKAEAMQGTLNQWLSSFTPPDSKGGEVKINKSTQEQLRALGYVR